MHRPSSRAAQRNAQSTSASFAWAVAMAAPAESWATRRLTCDDFQSSEQLATPSSPAREATVAVRTGTARAITCKWAVQYRRPGKRVGNTQSSSVTSCRLLQDRRWSPGATGTCRPAPQHGLDGVHHRRARTGLMLAACAPQVYSC
jgi:hypothetical protein